MLLKPFHHFKKTKVSNIKVWKMIYNCRIKQVVHDVLQYWCGWYNIIGYVVPSFFWRTSLSKKKLSCQEKKDKVFHGTETRGLTKLV